MPGVKKSLYLDAELIEPLKARAEFEGRSLTKQVNHMLRESLKVGSVRITTGPPPSSVWKGPDPKVKGGKR